jgi:hypothetical protein
VTTQCRPSLLSERQRRQRRAYRICVRRATRGRWCPRAECGDTTSGHERNQGMKAAAQNTYCASKKRLDKAQRWTVMHHTAPSHMDRTKVESPARWHRVRLMCGGVCGLIGSRAPGAGILPSRSCGKFVEQSRDSQWQGDADTSIGRTALSRHSL